MKRLLVVLLALCAIGLMFSTAAQEQSVGVDMSQVTLARVADTNSMYPTLKTGDVVAMAGVESSNQIAVGDIIVFSYGGISVVHRVIVTGIDANGWYAITRGDNNAAVDGKVRFAQIEGVVVGIV